MNQQREQRPSLRSDFVYQRKTDLPLVVVVGAGFAGINFVRSVEAEQCEVLILDRNNYHQFQPLLYQVAISGLEPDSIVSPIRRLFNQNKNVNYRMAEVKSVDPKERVLYLNNGKVDYDFLVFATGSKTNYYNNDNIAKHSIGLKTINDALNMRSWVLQNLERSSAEQNGASALKFVIAGAGPAGVELAGALAEFKRFLLKKDYPDINFDDFQIYLLEGGPKALAAMSDKAGEHAVKVLERLGVRVQLNAMVQDYDGETLTYKIGEKTHELSTNTLIWTAGVQGERIPGINPDCYTPDGRLKTNSFLEVDGMDGVYAIGDAGASMSEAYPKGHPMVAQTAIQQGQYLAKSLLLSRKKHFEYDDKGSMATVGMKDAVADINSFFLKGFVGWLLWSVVHLFGIIHFKNRLNVAFNWAIKYFRYDKANQLIIRKFRMDN